MTKPANENDLLRRITSNPNVFGGKPTIRNRRLAVEHVLGMLAAGDTPEIVLQGYPWLEPDDIRACLVYARRSQAVESALAEKLGRLARTRLATECAKLDPTLEQRLADEGLEGSTPPRERRGAKGSPQAAAGGSGRSPV